MATENKLLVISNAPHIRSGESINKIMWTVAAALVPAAAYSVYLFGARVLVLFACCVITSVVAETLTQLALGKKVTAFDGSAVITGILVAMNVPPGAPVWMTAIGSAFAVVIVKQLFGGLGFNIFNPALAARAFMLASWPAHMTTGWNVFENGNIISKAALNTAGFPQPVFDVMTHATPLTALKEGSAILGEYNINFDDFCAFLFSPEMLWSQFKGSIGGCVGETSAVLLLAGGVFLLVRKVITWHIPASYIGTVAALALLYYSVIGYPAPQMIALSHVLTGGLVLGAFFMATDMVTSPITGRGMVLFGAGCGLITFIIRIWGGYPEGVSYSILLMNAAVPLIDRFTKPKVFGRD
ncbi:MAG: RnfABCDGE type electron transport complex subunit D [Spirochaetia bacterium]|jgi:electron transport complex protein RnfD|nr:RnfABCDGE type electron transport complex subunit D [Spirochaetia bacterium]